MRRVASLLGALGPPRSTGRAGIALAVIGVVALAVGLIVGGGLPASSRGASPAAKVSGAATVQRRDLVATDTESGTLNYANSQTVFNRLSGTITWLPSVGQLINPGQALYQVDGQPVVLFNGTTPAYRDLTSGVGDGADVLELNRDLVSMGFDPNHEITVDNSWQTGTTDAVERWQGSLGQTETGTISLGQVVFLPGTQRINSVDAVLGSTGGSSAAGASGAGSSGAGSAAGGTSGASGEFDARPEFASLTVSQPTSGGAATGSGHDSQASAARVSAAAVRAAWASACAQHDLSRLATLAQAHPALLGSRQISACAAQPARPKPASPSPRPAARVSAITSSWDGSAAAVEDRRRPTGSSTPGSTTPKRSSSSGTGANNQILPALKALLRAETLLLQRSAGSSGRGSGGSSGGSLSGSSSALAAAGGSRGGASGGGSLSGGASASGSGGASGASGASGVGGASGAGSSSGAGNAQAILATTSNQLNVVVNLDATKQSEAVVGEPVTVEMPDGSIVNGTITQVSPVAQSSSSSSGSSGASGAGGSGGSGSSSSSSGSGGSSSTPSATIPVTIALHGHVPASGLDQAAVSVNFEQQVERGVLSVPVTALLATAGGGYAVQEAAAPHRLLPVTPGLFAAGYVQISSAEIYPGLQVTDSQG